MAGSSTSPFMLDVSNMIDERIESAIFRAIVTAITPDSVRIKRVGATDEDAQDYAACDIYPFPQVDDEVMVLRAGKGYVVMGRIVRSGLDVLHNQLSDLEISGVLTMGVGGSIIIGAGGFIEDADGSRWDQEGLRLVSGGAVADAVIFAALGDDIGYIQAENAAPAMCVAMNSGTVTRPPSLILRDEFVELGFNGLGFSTIGIPAVRVEFDNGTGTGGLVLCDGSTIPGSIGFGGGTGIFYVQNAFAVPTTNPASGGFLYAQAGAGRWRGSGGTVTTFGPAEPHCQDCGRDFALEWENDKYGKLALCMWCVTEGMSKGVIERRLPT